MKKILIIITLILVLTCNVVFAADIPEPTSDFYVNDTANVLSEQTKKLIIDKNVALYDKTGAQIVVVTVEFTNTASIADYAYELFNEYKIGSKDKNNGLLLLLSIGDDDYYALQGAGLERTFTSGTISYLLYEYLEPYFAQQEYDTGVLSVFNAFYEEMLAVHDTAIDTPVEYPNEYEYYPEEYYYGPDTSINIFDVFRTFFIIIVIIAVLISIFGTRKSTKRTYSSTQTRSSSSNSNIWPFLGAMYLLNKNKNNSSFFNLNNNHNTINRSSSSFRGTSSFGGGSSFGGRSGGFHSGGGGVSRGGGAGRGGR